MSNRRIPVNCVVERVCLSDQTLREAVGSASERLNVNSGSKPSNCITAAIERVVLEGSETGGVGEVKQKLEVKVDADAHWNAAQFAQGAKDCGSERGVTTTPIGEQFVVMNAEAPFADVLNLALEELKYNPTDVVHTVGSLQIKNWKPLPLSTVAESTNATIGEVLAEIANSATLRIKMITVQPHMLPSWINLLRASANADHEATDRANGAPNAHSSANTNTNAPANAFAALCSGDFRNVLANVGSLAALAAAQQQASLFSASHQTAVDRCACPDGSSPARVRQFGSPDLQTEHLLGSIQSLPPSSLAAFMLFQHHAAQQMASLHGDVPQVNRLLLADSANVNVSASHCNGALGSELMSGELKCVDLAGLRRENGSVNFGVVGISSDSADTKALCNHQQQRLRTSFDTEHEIPLLQGWFSENQHPSREQMMHYLNILNGLDTRKTRRQLDLTNIIYWFKNSRAALRRTTRTQPQRKETSAEAGIAQYLTADRHTDALGDSVERKPAHLAIQNESTNTNNNEDKQIENDHEHENESAEISVDSDGDEDQDRACVNGKQPKFTGKNAALLQADVKIGIGIGIGIGAPLGGKHDNCAANVDNNNGVNMNKLDVESRSDNMLYTPSSSVGSLNSHAAPRGDSASTTTSQFDSSITQSYFPKTTTPSNQSGERKRTRIFVDPLTEVPYLESWFSQNAHPDMKMIEEYCCRLNSSQYRSKFPKLEPKNIQLWFKNHRSKVKRLSTGVDEKAIDAAKIRESSAESSLVNDLA